MPFHRAFLLIWIIAGALPASTLAQNWGTVSGEVSERGTSTTLPGVVAVGAVASTTQMLMLGLAAAFVINALLVGIITVWWKISIHASAVAGVVALVVGMIPFPFIHVDASTLAVVMSGSIAALAAVMWSRVRLDAHSRAEVAVGAIFGMLITWVELYFITSLLP